MKTLKTFETFLGGKKDDSKPVNAQREKKLDEYDFELSESAIGLDIKNDITKLINDKKGGTLDLGIVNDISKTDITNIKQTYKDATIKVVDGHYILSKK